MELNSIARRAITALLESPGSDLALQERAAFLACQVERLLQRLANRQANKRARTAARSRKWRWRAEDGPEPPPLIPRALIIDSVLPATGRDAGSNAILSHMETLQKLGFEVTIIPADLEITDGFEELSQRGIGVIGSPWAASVEELLRRQSESFNLVYLHRVENAFNYLSLVRRYIPKARIIFSVADLHFLRLARQAKVEDRPELIAASKALQQREFMAVAASHTTLTHSSIEAEILKKALPTAVVVVVPWTIDTPVTPASYEERSGIAFLGNFRHAPNLDAVYWLATEIMPLVWEQSPNIRCYIAGSDMPDFRSTIPDPRMVFLGKVESLSEIFGKVRLTVAPLAYGAGLKGKVADSLAAGVPCVCTPVAAEGFGFVPPLCDLVAEDSTAIAALIVRLHSNQELFNVCREAAIELIKKNFSQKLVEAGLRRAAGLPLLDQSELI